jgi:hypothetical protein
MNWRPGAIWACIAICGLQPAPAQDSVSRLAVTVTEGEGAMNNTNVRASRGLSVEVRDAGGKPVKEATVVFTCPADGPSGVFGNGNKVSTVVTDGEGRAALAGFKPNSVAGKMVILVNASYRGQTASTAITQFNMTVGPAKSHGNGKLVAILLVAGAAAAGGAVAATHGSSSGKSATGAPAPPAIGISPGSGSISGPQ